MRGMTRPDAAPAEPADLDALRARWARALTAARGGAPEPDPAPYAENLLARWAEPQRRYHTLTHLTAVLDRVDELERYAADDDPDGQVLCDADLAVLASPPEAYAAYAAAVRQEYHFIPSELFREGRAAILRQLLELPRLFRTPYGAQHWEATARYNLRSEIDLLTG